MPPSSTGTAELLDAELYSNNDHCDLGFIVTACDVVRRPYRGHEAAMEDSMSKKVEGYVVPP
jgi:hypothetical protein